MWSFNFFSHIFFTALHLYGTAISVDVLLLYGDPNTKGYWSQPNFHLKFECLLIEPICFFFSRMRDMEFRGEKRTYDVRSALCV